MLHLLIVLVLAGGVACAPSTPREDISATVAAAVEATVTARLAAATPTPDADRAALAAWAKAIFDIERDVPRELYRRQVAEPTPALRRAVSDQQLKFLHELRAIAEVARRASLEVLATTPFRPVAVRKIYEALLASYQGQWLAAARLSFFRQERLEGVTSSAEKRKLEEEDWNAFNTSVETRRRALDDLRDLLRSQGIPPASVGG